MMRRRPVEWVGWVELGVGSCRGVKLIRRLGRRTVSKREWVEWECRCRVRWEWLLPVRELTVLVVLVSLQLFALV